MGARWSQSACHGTTLQSVSSFFSLLGLGSVRYSLAHRELWGQAWFLSGFWKQAVWKLLNSMSPGPAVLGIPEGLCRLWTLRSADQCLSSNMIVQ